LRASRPEPKNKAEYGKGYYADKLRNASSGYVHPYHTDANPLVFTHYNYMKTLFEAVGPEQVSPHYESLSRSRRGLIFLFAYIGSITSISRLGGWSHNEWIRNMIFHHEYLLAVYLGYIELRHFTFMLGPKFTIFYNVYTRYETQQLASQWADVAEQRQMIHLMDTKAQMEYVRINKEYDFVKKRALVNYLTNSRNDLENHFHGRAQNMLSSIERYEQTNLKFLLTGIGKGALEKVHASLADPVQGKNIREGAFQAALTGIRDGTMTYKNDPILPILQDEILKRTTAYKTLTAQEESNMLCLNADQKKTVTDQDKRDKAAYLATVPNINHPTVKGHEKYQSFVNTIKGAGH
jgi:hypothetical protein